MSEHRTPQRWKDSSAEAWPDGVHDAIVGYAKIQPSAAAQARMFERLEAEIAGRAGPAAHGRRRAAWWLGAGGVIGVVLVAWYMLAAPFSRRADAPSPAHVQRPLSTERASRVEDVHGSQEAPEPPAADPPAGEAPARVAPRMRMAPKLATPKPAAPPPTAAARPDPRAELELLIRARSVVGSAPAKALALVNEHAAKYPYSSFDEEREVLAIQAERRLGRSAAADARAQRFLREHPSSVHRAAVESGAAD